MEEKKVSDDTSDEANQNKDFVRASDDSDSEDNISVENATAPGGNIGNEPMCKSTSSGE